MGWKSEEARQAYNKAYYAARADKAKEKQKAYRANKSEAELEAERIYQKEYRAKNKEALKLKDAARHDKNKERKAIQKKEYDTANKAARIARYNVYKATPEGRGIINAGLTRTRVAKLKRTPTWLSETDKWMIKEIYLLSALRTELTGVEWHVDHIIPLRGKKISGLHIPSNLRVITATENLHKSNKSQ